MWGSQTFDIKPDILTCAKALSSSYLPISAVMASSEIVEGVEKQAAKLHDNQLRKSIIKKGRRGRRPAITGETM